MDIKIQPIHFDITQKLNDFIQKKLAKVEKNCDLIHKAEVNLKVVKPETAMNKETSIRLFMPGNEIYVTKVCDTFEEGIDSCLDVLLRQVEKYKEKRGNK